MSNISFLEFLYNREDIVQDIKECFDDYLYFHQDERLLDEELGKILKMYSLDFVVYHQAVIPLKDNKSIVHYRNEIKKKLIKELESLDKLDTLYVARVIDLMKDSKVTCCYYDKTISETCLIISAGKCVEVNLKTLERQEMPDEFLSLT